MSTASNRSGKRTLLARAVRRKTNDVGRIEIGQFQPILIDVAGREQLVLRPTAPSVIASTASCVQRRQTALVGARADGRNEVTR